MNNICKNCCEIIEWGENQKMYNKTGNPEYDYTCPCEYCALNNIGY